VLSQVIGPPNATYQQMQEVRDWFSISRASCPSSTPRSTHRHAGRHQGFGGML